MRQPWILVPAFGLRRLRRPDAAREHEGGDEDPWLSHGSVLRLCEAGVGDRDVRLDRRERDLLLVLAPFAAGLDRVRQVPAGDFLVVAERGLELLLGAADHAL